MKHSQGWTSIAPPLLATVGLMVACSGSSPGAAGEPCAGQETMCFEHPEYILVCSEEDGTWEAHRCEEGTLCHEGECQDLECVPGMTTCDGDAVVACSSDGQELRPQDCPQGETCHDGECLPKICEEGEIRCVDESSIERCEDNGTAWRVSRECPAGTVCMDDACLPSPCTPGETKCGPTVLYSCDESGEWTAEPCPNGQPCVFGRCVECVSDDGCDRGEVCEDGLCVVSRPVIVTSSLPAGTEGLAYEAALEISGGLAPFDWDVTEGTLPEGIGLYHDGRLLGTPEAAGISLFTVRVTDARSNHDEREYSIEIVSEGGDVRMMTTSLPAAMHGYPYQFDLQATGGTLPYAWQLLDGVLPIGIELGSSGRLAGVPDEIGTFPVTLRVLDAQSPPSFEAGDLSLTVEIAPLEIVGEEEYDLLLTKIIILPMLIPYIPYSAQLEARGGLPPYTWNEEPAPSGLDWIIPEWGLPDDLEISADGVVSGWVTDVSDAVEVSIPFTDISLTGYFFNAKVTDSQDPPDTDEAEAVFCVPTVPL